MVYIVYNNYNYYYTTEVDAINLNGKVDWDIPWCMISYYFFNTRPHISYFCLTGNWIFLFIYKLLKLVTEYNISKNISYKKYILK